MKYLTRQIFKGWNWLCLKIGKTAIFILVFAVFILILLFYSQIFGSDLKNAEIYFLDVGQGDSQLVRFPGGVDVLIDGGPPNGRAVIELNDILGFSDRYIDLVVLSHPQMDHFGGLIEVFKNYRIGAFLYSGRAGNSKALTDLEDLINKYQINSLIVDSGDSIIYEDFVFDILLPNKETIKYEDLNDTSVVSNLKADGVDVLFTGDIGKEVENIIRDRYKDNNIDVLKVPHHGSKYSSSWEFLDWADPDISLIQVGSNSYGHPTDEVISRLKDVGSKVFRNDKHGTLKIELVSDDLRIFSKLNSN